MRVTLFAAAFLALFGACESTPKIPAAPAAPIAPKAVLTADGAPVGLPRYMKCTDKIGQGAQPEGEVAFQNLAALGYTTALSVDGAEPAVDLAARYGIRYVHLPIGYDGVPADRARMIVKAVETSPGPVYIHCHHGKHRGPTAVAIALIAAGYTNSQALEHLVRSGTSPHYAGLYRDIREFSAPSVSELARLPEEFPSRVHPDGVVEVMVGVSHRFELLKASRGAGWTAPENHPDVDPPHEARMLWEQYRELSRLGRAGDKGANFFVLLRNGEEAAVDLEQALRRGDAEGSNKAYGRVRQNCQSCHADFRD